MTSVKSPWLVRTRSREHPRLRLICFSYAGMGASVYARWPDHLPQEIEVVTVQPPGREGRLLEPAWTSLQAIADKAANEIGSHIPGPIALFGHSMGAVIAHETARLLAAHGREPQHVFVSGRRAPHLADRDSPLHHLDDADFVDAIGRRYAAIPAAVLEDKDLFALLLPTLRADIAALETHPLREGVTLSCNLTAYGGVEDARVLPAELDAWRETTTGTFRARMFPGGHFYMVAERAALIADVSSTLAPAMSRIPTDVSA
jgi:surfactin synthase thioesterase subunit